MRAIEKKLRERIKELEGEVSILENERIKFRAHFVKRFRWWLALIGKGTNPNLTWLVEDDAKFLVNVEKWWW